MLSQSRVFRKQYETKRKSVVTNIFGRYVAILKNSMIPTLWSEIDHFQFFQKVACRTFELLLLVANKILLDSKHQSRYRVSWQYCIDWRCLFLNCNKNIAHHLHTWERHSHESTYYLQGPIHGMSIFQRKS